MTALFFNIFQNMFISLLTKDLLVSEIMCSLHRHFSTKYRKRMLQIVFWKLIYVSERTLFFMLIIIKAFSEQTILDQLCSLDDHSVTLSDRKLRWISFTACGTIVFKCISLFKNRKDPGISSFKSISTSNMFQYFVDGFS